MARCNAFFVESSLRRPSLYISLFFNFFLLAPAMDPQTPLSDNDNEEGMSDEDKENDGGAADDVELQVPRSSSDGDDTVEAVELTATGDCAAAHAGAAIDTPVCRHGACFRCTLGRLVQRQEDQGCMEA